MKRALSLVLAAALVLGSIPAGFAATSTAGETLKGYGVVAGDTNGSLNEDKTITRAEMMTVLARLLGKYEEASKYSIPSTSKDVTGHWNAKVIAFAEKEGWTTGIGNGMFDPQGTVTLQQAATFMLKALGYTVTDFSKVVEEATKLGLLKDVVAKDATAKVLRSDIFTAALNTLNTPAKDATVKLGEKLGYIKPDATASVVDLSSAKALSFKLVEVTLAADVKEVKAADFAVTDADGKVVEVKAATVMSAKTVWLDMADQAAGKVYTVKSGEKTVKFTGVAKDATAPVVAATSKVKDNVTVQIDFDKAVDPRTALVAANYTIDNSLQVTGAAFAKDADDKDITKSVVLTTSAQKEGTLYKLTVATKVTDLAGNVVKSADDANVVKFGGLKADTAAPKLTSAMGKNAVRVVLTFTEPSGLDKATAENVANYVITNKTDAAKTITVTKAELQQDSSKIWNTVELTTSTQTVGNNYEVVVKNVADKFGNVVSTTADYKTTFSGQPADTTGPSVTAEVKTNTSVEVKFNEVVDKTTAETVANYTINNDVTVVKAVLDSTKKIVTLTTSSQKAYQSYTVTVANVTDEYGNKVGSSNKGYFAGMPVDESKPTVKSAIASVVDGKYIVAVTFSEGMNDTAKVASNYFFGDAIGYGVEVEKKSDTLFNVRVNALEDLKNYTVKVTSVEDASGNMIDSDANTANFVGKATGDSETPKVVSAVAIDKSTFKVTFSKPMKLVAAAETLATQTYDAGTSVNADDADNYKLVVKGDTTYTNKLIGKSITTVASKDKKTVTLRVDGFEFESGKVYEVFVNGKDNADNVTFTGTDSLTADGTTLTIAKGDSYFTQLGANTSTKMVPEIVSAYALNRSTIYVKFNTEVAYKGVADGAVTLTKKSDNTVINNAAISTKVLTTDKTVLVVSTVGKGELEAGAVYTVKVVNNAHIKDLLETESLNADKASKDFTAPSTQNDLPSIASAQVVNSSQVRITLTEDVKATVIDTPANFEIYNGNTLVRAVNYAEFEGTSRNAINLYFDNAGLTNGSVYQVKVKVNGLEDLVGATNDKVVSTDFAATGNTITKVKISDVVKVNENTVRVIFNRPVQSTGGVDKTDFTLVDDATTITYVISSAVGYLNGAKLEAADHDAANEFVDAIDLVLDNKISTGTTVTVDMKGASGFTAKDSATVYTEGTSPVVQKTSKKYSGNAAIPTATVTVTTAGADAVVGPPAVDAVKEIVTIKFVSFTGSPAASVDVQFTFGGSVTEVVSLNVAGTITASDLAKAVNEAFAATATATEVKDFYDVTINGDTLTLTAKTAGDLANITVVVK